MSIDIRLPNITAKDEHGQIQQMRSYLHQLVEQLNWALNTVESYQGGNTSAAVRYEASQETSQQDAESTFNSIKALIIKSADIVKAYEETIFTDFNGKYFAESDFGTFVVETNRSIAENSREVLETYKSVQNITSSVAGLIDESRETNAYIKRGILDYDDNGDAIVGVEVGETTSNGSFIRYARFIADRLSFFDEGGTEVAYIGAGCLFVEGKTVFRGEIQLGLYITDTSEGLAFTWIGG